MPSVAAAVAARRRAPRRAVSRLATPGTSSSKTVVPPGMEPPARPRAAEGFVLGARSGATPAGSPGAPDVSGAPGAPGAPGRPSPSTATGPAGTPGEAENT